MKNVSKHLDELIKKLRNLIEPQNKITYYFLEQKTCFNNVEIYLN